MLTLLPGLATTAEPASGTGLEAELRRQRELLDEMQAGRQLGRDSELPLFDEETADPRIAPPAPTDRELPADIFEISRVRIRSGTWGNQLELKLEKRTLDADADGRPELIRYIDPESKFMIRQESDRNFDGVTDAWVDYEWGAPVRRTLDSNDDGKPDTWEVYESGRTVSREIDRDDDGVRDAFYRYEAGSLVQEQHDADNDGRVDLQITLHNRLRVRAEEDQNKDGRVDTWITYAKLGNAEMITRIERDRGGRGFADTFETFEALDGKATLSRKDEDLDGDRQIDVRSIFKNGKLVRREILNPEAVEAQTRS